MNRFRMPLRTLAVLLLALAGSVCVGATAQAAEVLELPEPVVKGAPQGDYSGKTVILHTNDIWGTPQGFPHLVWLRKEFERLGAETILADAGDYSFGPIYTSSSGSAAMELMNLAGYDVASLGDRDFTYGYDTMQRNVRIAAFPVLCANVLDDGLPICPASYTITTRAGLTVGFLGIITDSVVTNQTGGREDTTEIVKGRYIYNRVQEEIDALRREGAVVPAADVVIALSHVGVTPADTRSFTSLDIIRNTGGIDFMLDGNDQLPMTAGPRGEPIQSCGGSFAYIGVAVIDNAAGAVEDHYLVVPEDLPQDAEMLSAVQALEEQYAVEYGTVIARSDVNLNGDSVPGNRTEETNLGDLIADALIYAARSALPELQNGVAPLVGFTNGASIRAWIPAGDITRSMVRDAFPFANTVSVVWVKGSDLLEVLEASTGPLPESHSNGYPQSSGIVFTLDERIPYDAGDYYPGTSDASPRSIRRVTIESVQGEPFYPDRVYAVVTNNYCAAGNGPCYLFGQAERVYDTDIYVEQAITDYIQVQLGGVVPSGRYAKPRGDHIIIK